jgi:hypothetical protein
VSNPSRYRINRAYFLFLESSQKRKRAPTAGKETGRQGGTKGKGRKSQVESEEEEEEAVLSNDSEDERPSKGKRRKHVVESEEEDSQSYVAGSSSPPPPRVDRPPKRRQSADRPNYYALSRGPVLSGDSDAEDNAPSHVPPSKPPSKKASTSSKPPSKKASTSSKPPSKKASTSKPKVSLTNLRGDSDSEGDPSPLLSKAKAPAKQTRTQPTASNLKRKRNENDDEGGTRDAKQARYERRLARYEALDTIIEENSLPAFFWWLRHTMDVSGTPSDEDWADYVMLFINGAATVDPLGDFDHSLSPTQRLFKNKLTDRFFHWLNDVMCVAFPGNENAAHQLIDAYEVVTRKSS